MTLTRAEFKQIAHNIPTLCWLADAMGSIYWYNDRWYTYTGTTEPEMAGWGWKSVHHPATLGDVLVRWINCLETGNSFEMIFPLRGADGIYRPFLTRVEPLREPDGQVKSWFGVNTEVSSTLDGRDHEEWTLLAAKMKAGA